MRLVNNIKFVWLENNPERACQYCIARNNGIAAGIVYSGDTILKISLGSTVAEVEKLIKSLFPNAKRSNTSPDNLDRQLSAYLAGDTITFNCKIALKHSDFSAEAIKACGTTIYRKKLNNSKDYFFAEGIKTSSNAQNRNDSHTIQNSFFAKAIKACSKVPYGKVLTYAQLAKAAGNEKAARAAGSAMRNNPTPLVVPCHRIIRSNGSLGNYSGANGTETKSALLMMEKKLFQVDSRN